MDETLAVSSQVLLEAELKNAYTLRSSDLQKSIALTHHVLSQAVASDFKQLTANAQTHLGLFYLIQGEFKKSLDFTQQALSFYQVTNNTKGIADSKYNIGSVYYRTNKYHQALLIFLEGLTLYRELEDHYNIARTLKSMGTIYEYFNDQDKAIESYEKSLEACRKINDWGLESNALNPLSYIYFKQGKEAQAEEMIERSIRLKRETNDVRGLAFALYGRGKIRILQKRFAEAVPDLLESIRIHEFAGDKLGLGMAYNKLGVAYMELNDLAASRKCFLKVIELYDSSNVEFIRFKANYNLYRLAKKEGDAVRAIDYLEKYLTHKESVINKENYNLIKSYEAVHKIESLEREAKSQKEKSEIIERKNAELDSFFYRISHDLKGPISSLIGLYSVVKMDVKDEEMLTLFDMYHSRVLRLNDIVMGLIQLTETTNTEKLKVRVNLSALVDECVKSCQYLPQFNAVKVIKVIQVKEFYSEWAIINTILQNLIENAIKYSQPLPEAYLKIRLYEEDGHLIIVAEDNGQGIPEANQQNIFDMFYRANNRSQGSGLGLYILKRAVERLHGSIEFTSTINVGSTFTVKLPIVAPTLAQPA
ncbi:MAG: tetratricopeptide repeat-containing sensor histidine kinase [Cyclobacteriaceae bacterium]|nr:tetratricopeptide repeat-containing sensor histidine kinase [Cyclobacteriaceae bacterium]